jgi:hypothetical protein
MLLLLVLLLRVPLLPVSLVEIGGMAQDVDPSLFASQELYLRAMKREDYFGYQS